MNHGTDAHGRHDRRMNPLTSGQRTILTVTICLLFMAALLALLVAATIGPAIIAIFRTF
jgi:hypothetical protein